MRSTCMPKFVITVVNDEFIAENDEEHAAAEDARDQALKGALELGVEQILSGKSFFGAEVIVSDGNSRQRFLVSVGASPLI